MVKSVSKFHLYYTLIPYERNQDYIYAGEKRGPITCVVGVTDGWNNPNILRGDASGRHVAECVAKRFTELFIALNIKHIEKRAEIVAKRINEEVLKAYPFHVACVGIFLFKESKRTIVVSVGSVRIMSWGGESWKNLQGIHQYPLRLSHNPSGTSRFFGRGELRDDPKYCASPDVAYCDNETPLLVATDGIVHAISREALNRITRANKNKHPNYILKQIEEEIKKIKKQNYDTSILLRWKFL